MPFKSDEDVRNYVRKRRRSGKSCSVSHLRRALNVGYKKAKRIADEVDEEIKKEIQEHPERAHLLMPPPTKRGGKKRARRELEEEDQGEEDDQQEGEEALDQGAEGGETKSKRARRKGRGKGWARKKIRTTRLSPEDDEKEEEEEEEGEYEKHMEKEIAEEEEVRSAEEGSEVSDDTIRDHIRTKLSQGEVIYVNEMRGLFSSYPQVRRVVQEFVDMGKIQKLPKGYGAPSLQLPKKRGAWERKKEVSEKARRIEADDSPAVLLNGHQDYSGFNDQEDLKSEPPIDINGSNNFRTPKQKAKEENKIAEQLEKEKQNEKSGEGVASEISSMADPPAAEAETPKELNQSDQNLNTLAVSEPLTAEEAL